MKLCKVNANSVLCWAIWRHWAGNGLWRLCQCPTILYQDQDQFPHSHSLMCKAIWTNLHIHCLHEGKKPQAWGSMMTLWMIEYPFLIRAVPKHGSIPLTCSLVCNGDRLSDWWTWRYISKRANINILDSSNSEVQNNLSIWLLFNHLVCRRQWRQQVMMPGIPTFLEAI